MDHFKDYNPVKAQIARYNGRSRGFGFIQLETHENQEKAVKDLDNTELEGRPLTVKPAVVDLSAVPEPSAEGEEGEAAEGEAKNE